MLSPLFLSLVFSVSAVTTKSYPAQFKNCYDGDTCTFDLTLSDQVLEVGLGITERIIITRANQTLRLCDINAPEIKPGPNPAAIKARDDLVTWITAARNVQILVPQKPNCIPAPGTSCDSFEKYGRLLAYIVADDINLNQRQVTEKNAVPFILCK
jgi:endonuclease YncB( thermonuclease family)